MSDRVVTELIVDARGAQQGTADYEAALRVAQRAVDRLTESEAKRKQQENAGGGQTGERLRETTREYTSAERAANAYLARIDPLIGAQQRLGKETVTIEAALKGLDQQLMRGAVTVDQYNQRQAALSGRLDETKAASAGLVAGTLTVERALKSLSTQAEATALSAREVAAAEAQLAAQTRQWIQVADPAAAAQMRLNEARATGDKLLAAGKITNEQYTAGIVAVGQQSGTATWALRGMGIQAYDVAQQLASGAPILTTFIQQGGQVAQMAAISGISFKQMAAATASWVTGMVAAHPVIATLTLITAGTVALGAASESTAKKTLALQNQLRATVADYKSAADEVNAAAKAIAASTGISQDDARKTGGEIRSSPYFDSTQQDLQALIRVAADLDAVFQKAGAGSELLTKLLKDTGAASKELADRHFPGMSQSLALAIQKMQDGGDRTKAFNTALDAIQSSAGGARENGITPLGRALEDLGKAFTTAGQSGRSLADDIGAAITSAALAAIDAVKRIIGAINELREYASKQNIGLPSIGEIVTAPFGGAARFAGRAAGDALATSGADRVASLMAERDTLIADLGKISESAAAMGVGAGGRLRLQQVEDELELTKQTVGRVEQIVVRANAGTRLSDEQFSPTRNPRVDDALGQARSIYESSKAGQVANLTKQRDEFIELRKQVQAGSTDYQLFSNSITELNKKIEDTSKKTEGSTRKNEEHRSGLEKTTDKIAAQIEAQRRLGEAYRAGGGDIALINAELKAQEQVISGGKLQPGMVGYAEAVQKATAANLELARVTGSTEIAKQIDETNKATEAQLRISASWDGSAESLEHLQNLEAARALALSKDLTPGQEDYNQAVSDYSEALDRGSEATRQFQDAQRSMEALSNILGNAFDRLGDALVQAFVSGQGSAVNFGNVMKGIVSSILSDVAKLAIINPILNSILPSSQGARPTLGAALGGFGGGGIGGGGAGGLMGNVGTLGTVGGAVNTLSGGSLYDMLGVSNIGSRLGLTGPNSLMSGATNFLNSGIMGTSTIEAFAAGAPAFNSAASGLSSVSFGADAGAVYSNLASQSFAPATGMFGGASVGSLLGGAAAGYGVGSFAGGYLQSAMNKTGPGPEIGAAIGTAIGTAILPGVGSVIGGLLGGLGGGMIGPRPPSPYTYTQFGFNAATGGLQTGKSENQIMSSNAAETAASIANFNATLSNLGLSIETMTTRLGTVTPTTPGAGGQFGVGKEEGTSLVAGNLQELISKFTFTSSNPDLARYLKGQSFPDQNALAAAVQQFQAVHKAIIEFLDGTVASMTKARTVTGSLNDAVAQLGAQYDAAIQQAQVLASNTAASADQVARLTQAQTDLTVARDAEIAKLQQQTMDQLANTNRGFDARFFTAQAQLTGQGGTEAALFAFDQQAQAERVQFSEQLRATFGDVFLSTQGYADQMASLERALGTERLLILKAANDNLLQAANDNSAQLLQATRDNAAQLASAAITNINDYLRKLQFGQDSALSPQSQYDLATKQFDTVARAAHAGDASSIQQLPQVADALINASKVVNGGGAGFAADFQKVIEKLGAFGQTPPDALVLVFSSETRTQTQVLSGDIRSLQTTMNNILTEIRAQGLRSAPRAA